jgi:hypothetical protein
MGYGRLGVYLHEEMQKMGVTVYDSIAEAPFDPVTTVRDNMFGGPRTAGMTNVICWCSVPSHARGWWQGQVPVLLSMWEAMALPESYRENMHEFDTVIVPSMQNVELYSKYHPNVKYVPLGVDPVRWQFRERTKPTTRFNFLIGGSGARKGTDLAYKAFRRLWGKEGSWPKDGPVPYLQMKSPRPEDFYGPRIEIIGGRLPAEAEVNLYADAHCYLQPSRGEGWGLQPLQAIAQGCPTILTDAHGHAAFARYGMGIGSKLAPSSYFIFGEAGDWWEPDLDELCDTMLWTYNNYDEAVEYARWGSERVLHQFTWEKSTNLFLEAIGRDRLGPYTGSGEWHKSETKLYKVITNQNITSDIGGILYQFEEGVERWVPADVKRIHFEGGKLDPACLDLSAEEDLGLLPEQVARIPGYLDRASYCPHCHQKLGSGPTIATEIMDGTRQPPDRMDDRRNHHLNV